MKEKRSSESTEKLASRRSSSSRESERPSPSSKMRMGCFAFGSSSWASKVLMESNRSA